MPAKIKEILIAWLIICLLAGMGTASYAMNSEMTFNLDGFTIEPSEPPQQWQTVQPQTESAFQQSVPQQFLPENSIQFDQGFTASTLFGEPQSGYQLYWDNGHIYRVRCGLHGMQLDEFIYLHLQMRNMDYHYQQ